LPENCPNIINFWHSKHVSFNQKHLENKGEMNCSGATSYLEPSGGWRWVTGEAWSFTRWSRFEPNNNYASASEEYAHLSYDTGAGEAQLDAVWNDIVLNPSDAVKGFIVEASPR